MAPLRKPPQQLTRLELQIMKVLWDIGPAPVQAVQERLSGEKLAYTTVQTMLNVLHRKGRVKRVWQVPAVAIAAALCARLMRRTPSEYTHRLWVAALLLSALLPLLSLGSAVGGLGAAATAAKQFHGEIPSSISNGSTHIFSWFGRGTHRQPPSFVPFVAWLLTSGFAVSCIYSLARLGWAWRRTMRFRAASHVRPLPDRLAEVVERSAAAFGRSGIPIFCSTETAGPLTIGLRHSVILLPEKVFGGVTAAE